MNDNIIITDIDWHNIYLNIHFEGQSLNEYNYFISDLRREMYKIDVQENKSIINIVNIENTELLTNGKWFFIAERGGIYQLIGMTAACGYKLEQLDKVFRYGREVYAYIVTFKTREQKEVLEEYDRAQKKMLEINIDHSGYDEMVCVMHTSYMMRNKRNAKRNILVESARLKTLIKKAAFIILKTGIDRVYHILSCFRRKDGKHILLLSETRTPIGGNLKALDDRLKCRGLDQEYHISYSFSKTLQQSKFRTLFVWLRLLWIIPKQDIIFVDDYVPIFKTIHLKPETKLVQLWHAGVGFKSVGYSRFGRTGSPLPLDSCHRQYSYAIVGGKGLIDVYEEVFGIPKASILPYGLARLDGYLEQDKIKEYHERFYTKYPELKDKKIILFAPTYRGKTQDEAYYPLEWVPADQVKQLCGDKYIFAYKMHPFVTEAIEIKPEEKSYIYDFSNEGDINELFYVTDILITDFSSNIYEFSLQRKPIIFYAPDKDFYQLTRGVHRTLDEAPGTVCEKFEEVIETIHEGKYDMEKLDRFVKDSFDENDKLASDSLIDNLILPLKENREV